ncbi:DUF896 family protein [Atopobacter phocae]|uniref:DUF896 family protein n=1 Tax=Atopobacter phocae TaxID=136492 RepID=UPI00046FD4BC|nr:DUF896 family protein [Atopobacter phocae]
MLSQDKMDRINALAKKKKAEGLTEAEQVEQDQLRQEYLTVFRTGMRQHIEGMKVVDQEGNDVTPNRLKEVQKNKKIHNRHLKNI